MIFSPELLKIVTIILKIIGGLLLLLFAYLFVGYSTSHPDKEYGITWSIDYAQYLGIDPYEGLDKALDELGVRHVRVPGYWTHAEPARGTYDWSFLDRQLGAIGRRGGKVTLVIGAKQPRWPECWYPDWAKTLSMEERHTAQLAYARAAIERYKHHPALERWQIENEPMFLASFGDCSLYEPAIIKDEIALVRELDDTRKPISTTASGELSTWLFEPSGIDIGTSIYRVVSTPAAKRWSYWFFPSWFYARKAALRSFFFGGSVYVSEFQMEPWVHGDIRTTSPEDQFYTFDIKQMEKNIVYADRLKMKEIDFWGVEWWYWMKTQKGHPEFWDTMKKVFDQR